MSQIYFGMKLYIFRTVSLSIIRMELQFHLDPNRKLSTNLHDIYHFWVYSE